MLLDVVLPYYGDVDLMKQAVRCVLSQEYQHWRLLVVDDGFPDPEPARWFGGIDDPRVHYQRNTTNLGANANYRTCLTLVEAHCRVSSASSAGESIVPVGLAGLATINPSKPRPPIIFTVG